MSFSFKKIASILFCLILPHALLFAHEPSSRIDSLKLAFEREGQDSIKYEIAKKLVRHFIETDAHQGLTYSLEAFEIARKLGKTDRFSYHHNTSGLFLSYLGQYHEAMAEFEEGIKQLDFIPDEKQKANFLCSLNGNIGMCYGHLGEWEVEEAYYLEALRIADEYGFKSAQALFSNNLSKSYLDLKEYQKAKKYIDKAVDIIKKVDVPQAKVLPYLNLGSYMLAQGERDSATHYFTIGLKHAEASGSLYDKGAALIQLSEELIERKQFDKGSAYAEQALQVARKLGNQELLILTNLSLARTKRIVGNLSEAEAAVNQAKVFVKEGDLPNELKVFEEMERIAVARSNYKKAQELSLEIRAIKDTLLDIDRQKHLSSSVFRDRLNNLRIQSLEKDQKISEQAIRQRNTVIAFSVLALFLSLLAAVFLFRNIIQRRKYHRTLELRVKQRTEKLKELNEDLEQANFELKRFNRIVSHDLRAPLQNIQALSELVKEEVGEYGENSLHLALIGRSSKQISRLLEDLTYFFSYEQHQLKLEGFKLEELLGEVKLALKTQIEDKQVEMTATELPFIYSYWTPLFLTLKNLIENAIKYNESELPRLLISYKRVKQFHIIEVKDNGIGIAADHHEKVFEIFQRVFPQNKYDGSGLGLSISRKMIRAIGGEVLLQSSMVDKGSIFEIRLPVEEKLENVLEEKRSELG